MRRAVAVGFGVGAGAGVLLGTCVVAVSWLLRRYDEAEQRGGAR